MIIDKKNDTGEYSNYIVQYVGFKTNFDASNFIKRWSPFASGFKQASIITIDLYEVQEAENLIFISRNVLDTNTYFKNFPSGIAGAGSGGGISVTQMGGHWLQPDQIERQDKMILAFLISEMETAKATEISRLSCTDKGPYKQMLELLSSQETNFENQINCNHLKRM